MKSKNYYEILQVAHNEKTYASYTKSREESEIDFDEWLKEYLKKNR